MKLSGWGRYPLIDSVALGSAHQAWSQTFIPTGNLRSYGDAALAPVHFPYQHNRFIAFDEKTVI